jgi:hypothetical protein
MLYDLGMNRMESNDSYILRVLLAGRCLAMVRLFIEPFPNKGKRLNSHVTISCDQLI